MARESTSIADMPDAEVNDEPEVEDIAEESAGEFVSDDSDDEDSDSEVPVLTKKQR